MPKTPEDRLATIVAAKQARDGAAKQGQEQARMADIEEMRRMDAWRNQFTSQIAPKILAAQQRTNSVIGAGGYTLMNISSTCRDHHFGIMPILSYQLSCPRRPSDAPLTTPATISFALAREGRVEINSAALAPSSSSIEIDEFTEKDAMKEFEWFFEKAVLGE